MIKLDKNNQLLMSLKPIFSVMSKISLQNDRLPSKATVVQREAIIVQEMNVLNEHGYRLKYIKNIKKMHIDYLFKDWYQRDYALSTLQKRILIFSLLLELVGKKGMHKATLIDYPIPDYILNKEPKKLVKEKLDKNELIQKIEQMRKESKEFAIHAKLMLLFGLSKRESFNIKPVLSHCNEHLIISIGVSRGKVRKVEINSEEQLLLINEAKEIVQGKSIKLMPKGVKEEQWVNRFDYICKKFDIKPSNLSKAYYQEIENAF